MLNSYSQLLRNFTRYADLAWHANASPPYFGDGTASEAGLRSCGNFVFTAAMLSGKHGEQVGLGAMERKRLGERAGLAIDYMTRSHHTGEGACRDGGKWGLEWQSSWWTARMALGAAFLGDALSKDLRVGVRRVVVAEAKRQLGRTPPSGLVHDTKAEENAWDCEVLAVALSLYPQDECAGLWREKLCEFAINSLSVAADHNDPRIVDGRMIKEWNCTVNLHPAFQIENHGAYHFCYIASPMHSLTWSHFALISVGQEPPEALAHHLIDLWESCLHTFLDNRFAYIAGQDWARYTYGTYFMQPVLALLHGRYADPRARFVEERRLSRLEEEQRGNADGSFFGSRVTGGILSGQPLKYETDCFANVALAYLLHDHYQPRIDAPTDECFYADISGVHVSRETLTASARSPRAFASFSWSSLYSCEPMALFVPNGCDDETEWSPGNLVGRVLPAGMTTEPLFIQSMRETQNGFEVEGEQLVRDRKHWILERKIKLHVDVVRGQAEISCRVRTRRRTWVRLCEGLSLFLPNDLFNHGVRKLKSDTGCTTLRTHGSSAPIRGRVGTVLYKIRRELGRTETLRRCGERWINIENRLGVVVLNPGSGIWVSEGPENSGPEGLFCHRIVAPRTRRWFRAASGEILLDTRIVLLAGTAQETQEAACMLLGPGASKVIA